MQYRTGDSWNDAAIAHKTVRNGKAVLTVLIAEEGSFTITAIRLLGNDNKIVAETDENITKGSDVLTSMNPVQNKVITAKLNASDSVIGGLSSSLQDAFDSINNLKAADIGFSGDSILGTNVDYAITVLNNRKVEKETGKGLSTNDFTDVYKTKLDNLSANENKIIVDDVLSESSTNPVQNKKVVSRFKSIDSSIYTIQTKLDGIEEGANKTVVDDVLSESSTNPVQNNVNST